MRIALAVGLIVMALPAAAVEHAPFERAGIVSCALPGTVVEFALNGSGGAVLTKMQSNYAPFRKAGGIKTWSATTVTDGGLKTLVLDNLNKTRIMVKMPEGNGFAFTTPEGVSDILCQILVQPD